MQTAFNNADNNAIFILIFCENNLKIIATPKTFKIDTNKAVNIGTILFSLNIPSPILEHKRHNKVFKNKFIPKPENVKGVIKKLKQRKINLVTNHLLFL